LTTIATQIREAIFTRVSSLQTVQGYKTIRRILMPQLEPGDLPCASVAILTENLSPDGDANAASPHYFGEVTIGIGISRGFSDPVTITGQIDTDVDAIEAGLLTDPTFIVKGRNALFEAVSRISRKRIYAQEGETYFCELRLELTFDIRIDYQPIIPDAFELMVVTLQPNNDTSAPPVVIDINIPQ
jgi:hypothetical protein